MLLEPHDGSHQRRVIYGVRGERDSRRILAECTKQGAQSSRHR
jgi:hypothetical protein